MDSETTLLQIKETVRDFCEARDWDRFHNAKNLAIGVITEASELLEHFRFRTEEECTVMFSNPEKRTEIADEIADVLYFLARLSQKYDIDMSDEFFRKMKKSGEKYPVEMCRKKK